ncbi:MAG: 2OG-Fe(II) oxygenase [Terriglobia bacterium]
MIRERLEKIDWENATASLTANGFAQLPRVLSRKECCDLIQIYERADRFRSRIDMERYRFGRGEYQYFSYPLPPLVEDLRQSLYPRLVNVANTWIELFQSGGLFPPSLDELLVRCHERGQTRPTPLLLRYGPGDFNCLHKDIYGEIAFPFQVVFFLSEPDQDYSGGEFLLVEQAPRSQTMGRALKPRQGEALVITTRHRPAQGKRGPYRIGVRHGVSPIAAGSRWTLGIIFHDAQ